MCTQCVLHMYATFHTKHAIEPGIVMFFLVCLTHVVGSWFSIKIQDVHAYDYIKHTAETLVSVWDCKEYLKFVFVEKILIYFNQV